MALRPVIIWTPAITHELDFVVSARPHFAKEDLHSYQAQQAIDPKGNTDSADDWLYRAEHGIDHRTEALGTCDKPQWSQRAKDANGLQRPKC